MSSPSKPGRRESEVPKRLGPFGLIRKAFTVQMEDWDQEELLDTIHWQRQTISLACGLIWGLIPLTGFWAFIGFIAVNLILVLSWWRSQRIDEDEYGGMQALLGEGLPPSIGLFLVVWILVYTVTSRS